VTQQPPAKFVFAQEGRRMGVAVDSVVSAGCIVSGGRVMHSVLSPGVRVNSYCEVEYSILMPNAAVPANFGGPLSIQESRSPNRASSDSIRMRIGRKGTP